MRNRAAHTNSNQTRWHVPMVRKTKGGQVMAITKKDWQIINQALAQYEAMCHEDDGGAGESHKNRFGAGVIVGGLVYLMVAK